MKINFERDANGEITSIETITEKEGVLSDSERIQLQLFYDEELKRLKEKHAHEQKAHIYEEISKAFEAQKNIQTAIAKSTEEISKSSSNAFASFLNTEPKASQSNDKKIFMCRICGVARDSVYDYFVLAEDTEDAKRVVTNHSPLMSDDIHCIDIESLKTNMIKENNEIKLYG